MELIRFPEQVLNSSVKAKRTSEINVTPFASFPVEILEMVFKHAGVFDRCALALTCGRFAAVMVRNRWLTWHHNSGALLQPHTTNWLCMDGERCHYTEPATAELLTELLKTLPCVQSGFKHFQYFMERFWLDLPTWVELKYCSNCVEFRPRVCLERFEPSPRKTRVCIQMSTDDRPLIDSPNLDWADGDPVWFQKTATKYEPLFKGGLWYLKEIPLEKWGVEQVCPACRNKKLQPPSKEDVSTFSSSCRTRTL